MLSTMNTANNSPALETITLHFGPTVTLEPRMEIPCPKMFRAFALVSPDAWGRADWKEEIVAVLHPSDLDAAGVTLAEVEAAIVFYTATEANVRAVEVNAEPGVFAHVIKAPGYRRGPAA